MKILSIVGARPNFIKIAPLCRAFSCFPDMDNRLVHTGQHYDDSMSDIFFRELNLPKPDYFLGVGSGTHAAQTARIMLGFEKVLKKEQPDLVIVVGDVNSTLACALVAAKEQVPVAHIEAGLRSGDRTMPEEINRKLTDALSDTLFVTEKAGFDHLLEENISPQRIHWVGNLMIDAFIQYREKVANVSPVGVIMPEEPFVLMTMHRPANVDSKSRLSGILGVMKTIASQNKIIFPAHPRTLDQIKAFNLWEHFRNVPQVQIVGPQGYFSFLHLMQKCLLVITDSGGIQEEATFLQKTCITLRENTERPVTVELGTNYLLPDWNTEKVARLVKSISEGKGKTGRIPEMWDGHAAERIVSIIRNTYL